ncbi:MULTISPECIES: hypothetical protein [Pseudomonadaceae]|jgi:hypothetical protein|uniref:Uncharacterized protein n=1 Tax=Pseudomonas denitrificans TaxID=43306 RepID=A0A9X7N4X4_PSEDE|nr:MULTISPECIES: hypothetical protein [Pseudomonadaceae]OQR34189.1 hypothetical protein BWR15_09310 [Pseudomonas sp. T]MBD9516331.1 hypothetical protein [Pseudomonas sp. PDM22]MBD9631696.1 hypothetical protein [Pseudomonas sp. PDM19]MBD9682305.1 hypothetical protein [Pseudomonas sp. PDM20]QEY75237.1 hypothetical protein F1C79_28430 [Pseudomonas denitrificans (nom. rej.)]
MSITVTERDDDHKSREFRAHGGRCWDVHQEGQLVGIFHTEGEAQAYRASLELEARYRHAAEF